MCCAISTCWKTRPSSRSTTPIGLSQAGQTYIHTSPEDYDIATPRLGTVFLGQDVRDAISAPSAPRTIAHEIGHAIAYTPLDGEPA